MAQASTIANPPTTHTRQCHVRQVDTDGSGFVDISSYLRFCEETEYALLRSRELSNVLHDDLGILGFPRLHADCKILVPARVNDDLEIRLTLGKNDGKRLQYDFTIWRDDELIAEARIDAAVCRFPDDGSRPYAVPIPTQVLDKIPLTE